MICARLGSIRRVPVLSRCYRHGEGLSARGSRPLDGLLLAQGAVCHAVRPATVNADCGANQRHCCAPGTDGMRTAESKGWASRTREDKARLLTSAATHTEILTVTQVVNHRFRRFPSISTGSCGRSRRASMEGSADGSSCHTTSHSGAPYLWGGAVLAPQPPDLRPVAQQVPAFATADRR